MITSPPSTPYSLSLLLFLPIQVPDVRNVPQVIMATPLSPEGAASHASATTTLTCQTWTLATGRPESARNAFTTLRAATVASARVAILGTLHDATAEVSDMFSEKSLTLTCMLMFCK